MPDQILSLILDWILSNYDFLKAIVSWALDTSFLGILWARGRPAAAQAPPFPVPPECCVWEYPGQTYLDQ